LRKEEDLGLSEKALEILETQEVNGRAFLKTSKEEFQGSLVILVTRAEISSEIFCWRNCHMVTITMGIAGSTSKKTASMAQNGMLPEELNVVVSK